MQPLSDEQKELLFDSSMDLTTAAEAAKAKALVADNKEAEEIHSKLKAVLARLDTLQSEPCPDDLSQMTLGRLRQMANAEHTDSAQTFSAGRPWRHFVQVGAIAATVLIAVGVLIPSFSFARHQHRKQVCQSQLADIGKSMTHYCSDYDGNLPAVTTDVSQPWCNAGSRGKDGQSNNGNLYLLLKLGYCTRPKDFICCGRRQARVEPLTEISNYHDFPSSEHISYSFRVFCHPPVKMSLLAGQPLMADRNPVFERTQDDELLVRLDEVLATALSLNHDRRGQNVMFTDGRVRFLKTRHVGAPLDDMYTVQNVSEYRGRERPDCERDMFLAP